MIIQKAKPMQAVPRATALCLALLLQLLLLHYCQAPQFPAPLRAFMVLDYSFPGLSLSCRRAFFSRELVACQGDSKVCGSPHLSQIKFCPAARSDSAQTHWRATGHGRAGGTEVQQRLASAQQECLPTKPSQSSSASLSCLPVWNKSMLLQRRQRSSSSQ